MNTELPYAGLKWAHFLRVMLLVPLDQGTQGNKGRKGISLVVWLVKVVQKTQKTKTESLSSLCLGLSASGGFMGQMEANGDTSLCYQSSDINELNEAINNDLKQLDIWLQGNKLSLNVDKTNSMLVSTKQLHNILKSRNEVLDLKIRDNELEIIQKTKYLGVQIDNSFNWKEHIKTVSAKVSRAIGFLKHAKMFLRQETLMTL